VIGRARLFPTIVDRPDDFVVVDYDTLFAALNSDQPGLAAPTERWLFGQAPASAALTVTRLEARLRNDPLASGTRTVLGVTGILAAVLGLIGLVLATRSALSSERVVLAEYEALGVSPSALRRTAQLRLLVLSALGIAAGVAGGFLGVRLIGAFVAVTGTARRPLPPIAAVVDWIATSVVVAALVAAAVAAAALVAGRALREPAARRLRA
jgi:ABC-type antimicrobial peptide transport system permease subunit